MDKKVVLFMAIVGIAFCFPGLAYWEYLGTWAYVDPEGYGVDPEGKWGYEWRANGSFEGNPWYLSADGSANGKTWVCWRADQSPSEGVAVFSTAYGESEYEWVPDQGSRTISATVTVYISDAEVDYDGWALGWYDGACIATCGSGAQAYGWGRVHNQTRQAIGYGCGQATSGISAWARNGGWNAPPSENWTYAQYWPGSPWTYPPYAQYAGRRRFTATYQNSFTTPPQGKYFSVIAAVEGMCASQGSFQVNNPNYIIGYISAGASYKITGKTEVYLSGNIDDRQ